MNLTEKEAAIYAEFRDATRQLSTAEQAMADAQTRYKAALQAMNQMALAHKAG